MPARSERREPTAEARLRSSIDRLESAHRRLFRSVRAALRKRLPTATELAYDYGRSVVIGYSPTDRGIDAIVAIAARATGVFLYFNQGPRLPDPKGLLLGSGKQTRFVPVEAASRLAHPDLNALLTAAIDQARIPLPPRGKGTLIIKSDAATRQPRRGPKR